MGTAGVKVPGFHRIPVELKVQIARHLRAGNSSLLPLRNLCLVSKTLYSVYGDELYSRATLPQKCRYHPGINAALQLLRTVFERPDLAKKIKAISFTAVRRNVLALYKSENFDLVELHKKSLRELDKFGVSTPHPWRSSLVINVESAYVGVLLCLLPQLKDLSYTMRDHHRKRLSIDSLSAFIGVSVPPVKISNAIARLECLALWDMSVLWAFNFASLRTLRIQSFLVTDLMRLNGPDTFLGTSLLKELDIGASVAVMDEDAMVSLSVGFCDVINAFGCFALSTLRITLFNDAYCVEELPEFNSCYFLQQLKSLKSSLEVLEIDLDLGDEDVMWEFILDQTTDPPPRLDDFSCLKKLKVPFVFIGQSEGCKCPPIALPKKLQRLELVCPSLSVMKWIRKLDAAEHHFADFQTLIVSGREDVGAGLDIFCTKPTGLWHKLRRDFGIESFLLDKVDGTEKCLVELMHELHIEVVGRDIEDFNAWIEGGSNYNGYDSFIHLMRVDGHEDEDEDMDMDMD